LIKDIEVVRSVGDILEVEYGLRVCVCARVYVCVCVCVYVYVCMCVYVCREGGGLARSLQRDCSTNTGLEVSLGTERL